MSRQCANVATKVHTEKSAYREECIQRRVHTEYREGCIQRRVHTEKGAYREEEQWLLHTSKQPVPRQCANVATKVHTEKSAYREGCIQRRVHTEKGDMEESAYREEEQWLLHTSKQPVPKQCANVAT